MTKVEDAQRDYDAALESHKHLTQQATAAFGLVHRAQERLDAAKREAAAAVPVDRTQQQLLSGKPVPEDRSHTELQPSGMQKDYVVLSELERKNGFVRPYRDAYRHVGPPGPKYELRDLTKQEHENYDRHGYVKFEVYPKDPDRSSTGRYWTQPQLDAVGKGCGSITTMGRALSETYARDPKFYSGTFCSKCREHFPVGERGEFTWYEMDGREGPKVGT